MVIKRVNTGFDLIDAPSSSSSNFANASFRPTKRKRITTSKTSGGLPTCALTAATLGITSIPKKTTTTTTTTTVKKPQKKVCFAEGDDCIIDSELLSSSLSSSWYNRNDYARFRMEAGQIIQTVRQTSDISSLDPDVYCIRGIEKGALESASDRLVQRKWILQFIIRFFQTIQQNQQQQTTNDDVFVATTTTNRNNQELAIRTLYKDLTQDACKEAIDLAYVDEVEAKSYSHYSS